MYGWPGPELLTQRVAATPDRPAVRTVAHDRQWTYGALDTIVDELATRLAETIDTKAGESPRGTDPDSERPRVGFLVSTRVALLATLYATHRVGCVPVPFNTRQSMAGFEELVTKADPAALVCEGRSERIALQVAECPVLSVDEPTTDAVEPLVPSAAPPAFDLERATWKPEETALVLFTSGTTGDPRGVRLTLGNLVASAVASAFRLGVTPGDRWLCCLPPYHMGGLAPMFRSVLYGTTLVLQREFDAETTADVMAEHAVTGVSLVPTQLERLLQTGWQPPESLRTVLLGGAPASEDLVSRALERGVPVCPTYGLTETASQVATVRPGQAGSRSGSVGQPLFGTTVTVVDDGEPVESGVVGELLIDGPTVAPAYLDGEPLEDAGGFRTGDRGYRDDDGYLWVVGRTDERIQTGGELVAPTRVEAVLTDHPKVEGAAVVGLSDSEWGERVAGLVVPTAGEAESDANRESLEDALLDQCASQLADHEVPKELTVGESLPRTPSGTIDRNAVRERLQDS